MDKDYSIHMRWSFACRLVFMVYFVLGDLVGGFNGHRRILHVSEILKETSEG